MWWPAAVVKDVTYSSLLDLPAPGLGDLADAVARHALDDVLAVRHHERDVLAVTICVAFHANEARGGELIDLAPRLRIQVQRNPVPLLPRFLAPAQHRRIISAHLRGPRAFRRRAIEVLQHQRCDGVYAVIDAGRQDENEESVLLGRIQPQLRRGPEEQGPDIHGRPRAVRGDKLRVQTHSQMDALPEQLNGDLRHRDKGGGMLHALRVLLGPEDVDGLVVRGAEGFEAFVALLAVVQTGRHAVQAEEGVLDEFGRGPLPGRFAVVGFDVAVDFADAEADVVPVWRDVNLMSPWMCILMGCRYCLTNGVDGRRGEIGSHGQVYGVVRG